MQPHPVVGVARRRRQEERPLIEIGDVAVVEVQATELPVEAATGGAGNAHFLRPLIEIADLALRLAKTIGDAADREVRARTTIGIAATEPRRGLVCGDRGQRRRTKVVGRARRAAIGVVALRVVVPLVERHGVTRLG